LFCNALLHSFSPPIIIFEALLNFILFYLPIYFTISGPRHLKWRYAFKTILHVAQDHIHISFCYPIDKIYVIGKFSTLMFKTP
ncbi:TPA: hypothetical protein ACIV34_004657, partial [Salmonella enterica subsp. enterica serovar Java]